MASGNAVALMKGGAQAEEGLRAPLPPSDAGRDDRITLLSETFDVACRSGRIPRRAGFAPPISWHPTRLLLPRPMDIALAALAELFEPLRLLALMVGVGAGIGPMGFPVATGAFPAIVPDAAGG